MAEISIIKESIKFLKLSDEEYFSSKYSKYLSNSKLSLLNTNEGGSVSNFKKGFKNEYSDSFALGSAVHAAILQPDLYEISELTKPNGKLGIWAEEVYKLRSKGNTLIDSILIASETTDYYKYKLHGTRLKTAIKSALPFYLKRMKVSAKEKDILFLSNSLKPKFEACMTQLKKTDISNIIYPLGIFQTPEVFNEFAILCDLQYVDEETGEITIIPFKAKYDNISIDYEERVVSMVDLKTTFKPISYFMGNIVKGYDDNGIYKETNYIGSFQKYHYYRQMGIYLFLLQNTLKYLDYPADLKYKVSMLVVETNEQTKTKVFPVNNSYIKLGLAEFKELLSIYITNGLNK